ncbi:MAG: 50S ribosomal protein L25 [Candidatus Magasanikbacteria bacterium]|nr:50S ribosomal protein L25 [Candidatus Magasanikbacteria bacterium]
MVFTFTAQKRTEKNADVVRAAGQLPGILYGQGIEPVSLAADRVKFQKLYDQAGESSLIDFTVEGGKEPVKVLIQDIQYDPVKQKPIHFDLRQIRMDKEMDVTIQIHFINEPPAVKGLGGTLNKSIEEIDVRCLPKDLIGSVEVDLGVLQTFDDAIHIKDIKFPDGIKVMNKLDLVVAKVMPPLTEEQLKAMEESGPKSVEEVEVEKKGKVEEEGEAAAGEAGEKKEEKKEEKKKE